MKLEDHIFVWNYAAVKVLDIRHAVMEPGDNLQGYILPACGFIYCVRGTVKLESQRHRLRRRPSLYCAWWQGHETKYRDREVV